MKFDETKVFTPFKNAELKVGSKGYFSDCKGNLIDYVVIEEKAYWGTLESINNKTDYPFYASEKNNNFRYFYLVEEPKEKTKRPCTREEFVEMLKKQGLPMLKEKNVQDNYTVVIRSLTDNEITLGHGVCFTSYKSLCEHYTLLDGSELWVEE